LWHGLIPVNRRLHEFGYPWPMTLRQRQILIIQGHPDPAGGHFGHALAEAYREGASAAGHQVDDVRLADLDFPLLASERDWTGGELPPDLRPVQEMIAHCGWARRRPGSRASWNRSSDPGLRLPPMPAAASDSDFSGASRRASSSPWACPAWSTAATSGRMGTAISSETFCISAEFGQCAPASSVA